MCEVMTKWRRRSSNDTKANFSCTGIKNEKSLVKLAFDIQLRSWQWPVLIATLRDKSYIHWRMRTWPIITDRDNPCAGLISSNMLFTKRERGEELAKFGGRMSDRWPITRWIDICQMPIFYCLITNRLIVILRCSCINRYVGIILCVRPGNGRRRYNVTSSLIGWARDPWIWIQWRWAEWVSTIHESTLRQIERCYNNFWKPLFNSTFMYSSPGSLKACKIFGMV